MNLNERLAEVEELIAKAAGRAGRAREDIRLLAVTKTHNVEVIKSALTAGIEYIGENKVQEAEEKIPQLAGLYREFHFIGHLQTNKINKILNLKPSLIHSVDDLHLVEKLDRKLAESGNVQEILLQVNTSGEESKFGIMPEEAIEMAGQIREFKQIRLKGLMTIGRFTDQEKELRKSFVILRTLKEKIALQYPDVEMKWLSMGMSNDYEIAIEEGANLVRLGTVIFGPRACSLRN